MAREGAYVIPWSRVHPGLRADLLEALKGEDSGGSGVVAVFWEWCEKVTSDYA